MNLIVDIGNTRVKWALFDTFNLIHLEVSDKPLKSFFNRIIKNYSINNLIVSSVRTVAPKFSFDGFYIQLNFNTKLPIKNKYATPQSLGMDRIVNVTGGLWKYGKGPILSIDAGTCITYDFLDDKNNFIGGIISPGYEMRFKAMNNFTKKLPLVDHKKIKHFDLIGKTTKDSMISGVLGGMIHEIDGTIKEYKSKYRGLKVILTGGNTEIFETHLKSKIFAFPNLQLYGLNYILEYNYHAQKK